MKAGREHRVPLTVRSLEILKPVEAIKASDYVFPGQRRERPLSVLLWRSKWCCAG
jgi:integrase